MKIFKLLGFAIFSLLAANSVQAQLGCDRACLTGYIDTYFTALTTNNATTVPLA